MKILSYVLVFLLGGLVSYCGTEHFKESPNFGDIRKDSIKAKIEVKEKEVEVLKEKKKGISYTTNFKGFEPKTPERHPKDSVGGDTIPADCKAQEIFTELLKCDTVNQINDKIIAGLDTIVSDQKEVISILETDNSGLKKEVKKQKLKTLLTKIGAGIIIVAVLLLK